MDSARRPAAAAAVVVLAALGLYAPTATAAGSVTELVASADTYVSAAKPTAGYGTATKLFADGSPVMRALVRFDTAAMGQVTRATLRVFANRSTASFTVHRTTSAGWDERRVTYATAPALGTVGIASGPVAVNRWVSVDVTSLVVAGTPTSLALVTTSADAQTVASRETTTKPTLVLETGAAPDVTPPTASLTSPTSGATYTSAQAVPVTAAVSDAGGVTKVEYYDNGVLAAAVSAAPYTHSWPVSAATNGTHTWTAKAYDTAGNVGTSPAVTVTVAVPTAAPPKTVGPVTATAETMPVAHSGDAADDIAVWAHPTDRALSTVIGTDKQGGLDVYDLRGRLLHHYADSSPNNVDVRDDFVLYGRQTSIVTTSSKDDDALRVYRVDPVTRGLEYVAARTLSVGLGISGLCMYRSATTGRYYAFDSDSSGNLQQWELFDAGAGKIDARKVRTLQVGSTTEGCVADDALGHLYVAEEDVALWKYSAEPTGGTARTAVDTAGARLTPDIEGLALYDAGAGTGYLLASSQGSSTYAVYERGGANAYVTSFAVGSGPVDGTSSTDGIDVSALPLGPQFPEGVFLAQDGSNDGGNQNFKLVPWGSVARSVDPPLIVNGGGPPPPPRAPTTLYVDSALGDDLADGTTPDAALRSLDAVTSAVLVPGDRVLLRRGAAWTGMLHVSESGTSGLPIVVGAYGDGAPPRISGASTCLDLVGSHLHVAELHLDACGYAGVGVSGDDNRLQRSVVSSSSVGVYVRASAEGTVVTDNVIRDNNRMTVLTADKAGDDSGAMGVLLHGDRTEVAYNTISGSDAFSYDYGRDGAAIEVYGGRGSSIHHNTAIDNDAFAELGNPRSADSTFAYNVVRSALPTSTFVVTRGAGSAYGPVLRTRLVNNTVLMTGAEGQGFVCHAGCGPDILTMRNNVIKATWKVGYADAAFDEADGLYEGGTAQFVLGPGSARGVIGFRDEAGGDLRLTAGSAAVDSGSAQPYAEDADRLPVPVDGDGDGVARTDRGAYERH